jgi:DNA-binding transcriptional LysR family regulator
MEADELNLERLRAFLAVARSHNFSRAAERLGKTQPSVSQAIARLERAVGQPLFLREGRTTQLAPAGRLLLQHAERIFDELDQARERLAGLGALRAGELVVGTSDTLAYYLLPPVFAAFRARHPGIELRLDNRPSPATVAQVAERAVDLGVVTLPVRPDHRVLFEPLRTEVTDVVILPPRHPLARKRRLSLGELARQPLLLLDQTTATRATLDEAFARLGLRPRVAMEMSSVEVLKRLVELGFGLSVVPALAVARELRARTLAAAPLSGLSAHRRVALATPAASPLSPAAAAFAALARTTLRPGVRSPKPVG